MQDLIIDFFSRFRSDITQSKYQLRTINDYQKIKQYYDYLDYDQQTIYKQKNQKNQFLNTGLRNIGNTCYLNVFFQILYHINILREKIFTSEHKNSRFLEELKYLFGKMQTGKIIYADPTNLFLQLKNSHPDVFIDGVQNDFHQISTILFDQLKQSFKQFSQNDHKLIQKILFGKISTKTIHSQGKNIRNSRFNIINLDVKNENLQNALEEWKNYEIQDFITQNNKHVNAKVETEFIQTPAILCFFINRVSFLNNSLVKDNRQFKYKNFINLKKSKVVSNGSNTQINNNQKSNKKIQNNHRNQIQLLQYKQKLLKWVQKISQNKVILEKTLLYIEQKQFIDINSPQIQNKFQDQSNTKQYLTEQIQQISIKIIETEKQIENIDKKYRKIIQESQSQLYNLWGLMIHQGTSPTSGHYKVVLITEENKYIQFNDRKIYEINQQKINTYNKKGQICSLFYRRPNLECNNKKVGIPLSLKNKLIEMQKQTIIQIDKARLLQNLHKISEQAGFVVVQFIQNINKNKWNYFFKPIIHNYQSQNNLLECQAILAYQKLKDQNNVIKIVSSFISNNELKIPQLKFNIPEQYYKCSEIFKTFIIKDIQTQLIDQNYQWLSQSLSTLNITNKIVNIWFQKYLQIFIMKGIFYLCVLNQLTITIIIQKKFLNLSKTIQSLFKKLKLNTQFTLRYLVIKDEITDKFNQRIKNKKLNRNINQNQPTKILKSASNNIISKLMSVPIQQCFKQQFQYWINSRQKLSQIDQRIIDKQTQLQRKFIITFK